MCYMLIFKILCNIKHVHFENLENIFWYFFLVFGPGPLMVKGYFLDSMLYHQSWLLLSSENNMEYMGATQDDTVSKETK